MADKFAFWKAMHSKEWHCNYCRKALGTNVCVEFILGNDNHNTCREFLKKENYIVPKQFDAGILYAPYIPIYTKK